MLHLGNVPASTTLYIPFETFDSNGASVTLTGLATTDIEIYKNGSVTQRASDAGYALLDTDGIDFDGITGLHGISIDLGDNTDAGFYAGGSFYWVVISSVTVSAQTVNKIVATFRIVGAELTLGVPTADVTRWLGGAVATPTVTGVPEVDVTHFNGTAGTFASGIPEVKVNNIAANAITATSINADAITAAKLAADVTTEIQSGLATAAALATVDTVVDAILVDTAEIGAAGAGLTALATQASVNTIDDFIDTEVAAIKAKTDNLPATPAATGDAMTLTSAYDFAKGTVAMTESYAANGATMTPAQALYAIQQMLTMFAISGTSLTVKKLDNSTTAFVVTLDDATTPTSAVRT